MTRNDSIRIRKADINDFQLLFNVCRQSYSENFANHWNEGGLDWYLQEVYGIEGIKSDLVNSEINYFVAFFDEEPAGFMKLHLNSNLPNHFASSGMEIEKIYFRPQFQGQGIDIKAYGCCLGNRTKTSKRNNLAWGNRQQMRTQLNFTG